MIQHHRDTCNLKIYNECAFLFELMINKIFLDGKNTQYMERENIDRAK